MKLRLGGHAMADIMFRCPTLKVPVKTGLTTKTIVFESLSSWIEVPFQLPGLSRGSQVDAEGHLGE
jgi:hypothetical protein